MDGNSKNGLENEEKFESRKDRTQSLGPVHVHVSKSPKLHECRRQSTFCDMLSSAFSQDSRLNEEKAAELESRLKNLVSAFSIRVKKTKEEIVRPPTPSSEESDSDISAASEANLNDRLKALAPDASSETSRQQTKSPALSVISGQILRGIWNALRKVFKFIRCDYVLDPQSNLYICWLTIVSLWFVYNAWVIPLRAVFPYQTDENQPSWTIADFAADTVYLIDMIVFKSHAKFIQQGFWVKEARETLKFYFFSRKFVIDAISLLPVDIFFTLYYVNMPWLRLPRLFKVTTFWELFQILDNVLASPHAARIARTLIHMLYMIHLNASAYYALSRWEGINATDWTFDGEGNAYVRCFYFATKTATSIGKNPRPSNEIEYVFMTCAWLSGVFVFAVLIGQIRDIVATATKGQTEYRQVCYATDSYLHRFDVPSHLQHRVKSWLSYTWEQQKTLDEGKILAQLPQKMQADIALHVHIDTLSKVKLFQNCEVAFLRDLVVKLRSIIFLPGDFVCKKGEIGREMYIVKTGKVHVVGGASGTDILVTLQEGAVFGEIALLAIGGINKRTADVRSAGFSNLFVLSKVDLNEAIKDYPQAQASLQKKAKKLIREQAMKQKAQEKLEAEISAATSHRSSLTDLGSDKLIIKNKPPPPRILSILLKAIPKSSKTAQYIKYGSKASSATSIFPPLASYPPSPFLPPGHLGDSLSYKSDSLDSDEFFPSLPEVQNLGNNSSTMPALALTPQSMSNSSNNKSPEDPDEYLEGPRLRASLTLTLTSPDEHEQPIIPGTEVRFKELELETQETMSFPKDEESREQEQEPGTSASAAAMIDREGKGNEKVDEPESGMLGQAASVLAFSSRWKKVSGLKRQFSLDGDGDDGHHQGDRPPDDSDSDPDETKE